MDFSSSEAERPQRKPRKSANKTEQVYDIGLAPERSRRESKMPDRYASDRNVELSTVPDQTIPAYRYLCSETDCKASANTAPEVGRHYKTDSSHAGKAFNVQSVTVVPFLTYLAGETKATIHSKTLNKWGHLLKTTTYSATTKTAAAKVPKRPPKSKVQATNKRTRKRKSETSSPELSSPSPNLTPSPTAGASSSTGSSPCLILKVKGRRLATMQNQVSVPAPAILPPTLALAEPHKSDVVKLINETHYQKTLLLDYISADRLSQSRACHNEEIGAVFMAARLTLIDQVEAAKKNIEAALASKEKLRNDLVEHFLEDARNDFAEFEKVENRLKEELRVSIAEIERLKAQLIVGKKDEDEGPSKKKFRFAE